MSLDGSISTFYFKWNKFEWKWKPAGITALELSGFDFPCSGGRSSGKGEVEGNSFGRVCAKVNVHWKSQKKTKKTFELNYIILIAWQDEFDILKTKHKIKTVKFCSNTAAVLKCLIIEMRNTLKLSQLLHSVYWVWVKKYSFLKII